MSGLELLAVGAAIIIGTIGVVIPILPGPLLVFAAIAVWAFVEGGSAWAIFAVATVILAVVQVAKYLLPGRRLRDAGVPQRSVWVGAGLGIVGFFAIPVVGLFIGFVAGVYIAERQRLSNRDLAWPSTVAAVKAVGLSILIELAGCLVAGVCWLAGVVLVA